MELDFSKLDNIKARESSVEASPQEAKSQPLPKIEWEKEDHRRTMEMYGQYQENIKKSASLRGEILKGVQAGEDPEALFLKACEAISLMTGDTAFYRQIERSRETHPQ